jgi:predicted outer membrane repeat protein
MAPNSAATYILGGKTHDGQCQAFDMGSFQSAINIVQGKQLTLTADIDCPGVVLDASYKGWFFLLDGSKGGSATSTSLVLHGLTLRNGIAASGSGSFAGGAVQTIDGTLTVKNCAFESCTTFERGGAIGMSGSTILHAINTTFFNNSATEAGGAIFSGANTTLANCIFTSCSSSGAPGGAVFLSGSATITDSTFTGCWTKGAPGGAVSANANTTLTNCVFTDNTCNDCGMAPGGGAIYADPTYGDPTLEGCKFVVPANPSAGNNDLLGGATFACPPGTTGTPVTVAVGPHTIKQLPPSTEIVHCV